MISHYYREHKNDIPTAMKLLHTGLELAISEHDTMSQRTVLDHLAICEGGLGNFHAAQNHALEAERLAKISGHLLGEARALRIQSMCFNSLGDYKKSIAACSRARELIGLCGMSGGQMDNLIMNSQAEVHKLKSEYSEAHGIQVQMLHNASAEQDPFRHAHALLTLAEIGVSMDGVTREVQANIDKAVSMFTTIGFWRHMAWCDTIQADLKLRDGDFRTARSLYLKSLKSSWGTDLELVSYCLERLGDTGHWSAIDWTPTWTTVFLVQVLKLKQGLEIYKALQFQGDIFLAQGDEDTAASLFTLALEGFTQMDVHRSRAECMLRLGDISKGRGKLTKAVDLWKMAQQLFDRSSQAKRVSDVDARLLAIPQDVLEAHGDGLEHNASGGMAAESHDDLPAAMESLVLEGKVD
jgi:tetratricopeptide (TPR) repeat protein